MKNVDSVKNRLPSINLTLFTSRTDIGKLLYLNTRNKLAKEDWPLGKGGKPFDFEVLGFDGVDDLFDSCILSGEFDTRNALSFGLPPHKLDNGRIVVKGKERPSRALISRSRDYFAWPEGSGFLFLDFDDASDDPNATADETDAKLIEAAPWLRHVRRIYRPSSSSRICETDADSVRRPDDPIVSERASWHALLVVDDASFIPDIGRAILAASVDAGLGRIKVTASGTPLLRGLVDGHVWEPERVCYAFGPHFDDDRLYQDVEVYRYGSDEMLVAKDAPKLDEEARVRWEATSKECKRLFEDASPLVDEARAAWLERQVEEKGESVRAVYERAADIMELEADFALYHDDGSLIDSEDAWANPENYTGLPIRDPMEPDIAGKAMLWMQNKSFPCVHAYTHGPKVYRLIDPDDASREGLARLARTYAGVESGADKEDPVTPVMDLSDMLGELVYLRANRQVANRKTGGIMPVESVRLDVAASRQLIDKKPVPTFTLWLNDPNRVSVDDQSWHPGEGEMFEMEGRTVYNAWKGLPAYRAPDDWRERLEPFHDHLAFLVPVESERATFLQWLAHIFQKPGELPHSYYCHISLAQGIGRNWLFDVLRRALPGFVTPSVDLGQMIAGGFNGVLSRKLLAVVDEAHEIVEGPHRYQSAKAFRRMITEDYRLINPKCAPQFTEKNCVRWLMASNYPDPLPIEDADRRGVFIEGPDRPKDADYYARLYALLKDGEFTASVRQFFQTLDISAFNPGARAAKNRMKEKVIEAGKSDLDRAVEAFVASWPGWFALNKDVRHFVQDYLGHDKYRPEALAYALRRVGCQSVKKVKLKGKSELVVTMKSDDLTIARAQALDNYITEKLWDEWRAKEN